MSIEPHIVKGEDDLSSETPLYKYLSTEAFLYLYHFKRLRLSRVTIWPDAFEASLFRFLRKSSAYSNFKVSDFYGSCWSLQTEDESLYEDVKEYRFADAELEKKGSAAMWESYCKSGGVRIKTTIGKMDLLMQDELSGVAIHRGKVRYKPVETSIRRRYIRNALSAFFIKSPSFRYESEYRYLICPSTQKEDIIPVEINDVFAFIDEILISPATPRRKWMSRTLYNMAVTSFMDPNKHTNLKNGKQFCRTSNLYGVIGETVGHYDMF